MPLDDLQLAHGYSGFKAYSQSKLANVMFTYELDRRLEGTASANCFHPGWVATRIGAINPLLAPLMRLLTLFGARSPEQGAATAVQLALEAEGGQISGRYWFDGQPARTSKLSYDRDLWRRLWRESERLVGLNSDLALPEPTA
jgi:NAD(P)-dependent dehydrogenase (short-subunit alcohol dehydrogenase family)